MVPFTTSFTHAGSAKTSRVYSGGLLGSILAFAGFRVGGVETLLVKYSWWIVEGVDTTAPASRGAREKEQKGSTNCAVLVWELKFVAAGHSGVDSGMPRPGMGFSAVGETPVI